MTNDEPGSRIGQSVTLKMPPDGTEWLGIVKDEVYQKQSDNPDKELRLQLIEFSGGRIEVRCGYYIKGKKVGRLGKWVWGQFALMAPLEDFRNLVRAAEAKGWF